MKKQFWDNHNVDHTFLSKKARQSTSCAYLWFSLFKMHKSRGTYCFFMGQQSHVSYFYETFSLHICIFTDDEIPMNVDHVQAKRHFCNKIWNGFKFVTSYTDTAVDHSVPLSQCKDVMDKWILSRLSNLVDLCHEGFVSYDLQFCTKALQNFWVGDFCDIYLVCTIHVVFP